MKMRILAIAAALILLLCTGCSKQIQPNPEVEAFLNTDITAEKAYDAVAKVEYTVHQSKQNKAGQETGGYDLHVKIDKTDPQNLRLEFQQTYFGDGVNDGIESVRATIERVDGSYLYTTTKNGETKQEKAEDKFVTDYITSFFYMDNGAYNEGGLYYGDFFLLYIYKYPETAFSVDKEKNQCIFNEKMNITYEATGNVRLHQISKINVWGLLDSNYERYESIDQDMVLVSELTASYTFA